MYEQGSFTRWSNRQEIKFFWSRDVKTQALNFASSQGSSKPIFIFSELKKMLGVASTAGWRGGGHYLSRSYCQTHLIKIKNNDFKIIIFIQKVDDKY